MSLHDIDARVRQQTADLILGSASWAKVTFCLAAWRPHLRPGHPALKLLEEYRGCLRGERGAITDEEMTPLSIPDWTIGELLGQDEVWVTRHDGKLRMIRVEDMDAKHLANLRAWLLSRSEAMLASAAQYLYGMAPHLQSEQALLTLDTDIARLESANSREWMENQLLLLAITARMAALLEETHGSEKLCLA